MPFLDEGGYEKRQGSRVILGFHEGTCPRSSQGSRRAFVGLLDAESWETK